MPFLGERNQATVWRAPSPKMIMAGSQEERQDHPAQKPVVLFETLIRNHLRPGEAVYDPFAGSGTALVAAERLGRRCYAMEIDPRYAVRWQSLLGQPEDEILAALVADTEEMRDLRQCSPFAGVVTPDERLRVTREVHEDGYAGAEV